MKNSLESRLGFFFALVVVAGFVLFEVSGGSRWLARGQEMRVRFKSAGDLKVGDPVKLAGVTVGRVTGIGLTGQAVEVTLKVDAGADLRTDSTAQIRFTGLMGQNFVAIEFGSENAPRLAAGALLQAREHADLAQIFDKLNGVAEGVQSMTRTFNGDQMGQLLGPIAELVKVNQPQINLLMTNLASLTTGLLEGRGTIGLLLKDEALYASAVTVVTNLDSVTIDARALLGRADEMLTETGGLVGDARKVVGGIDRGEGSIGRLLKDDSLAKETTTAMTNLREILEKVNRGQGTVGKVVNDDSFLRNVKLTLQKVDKATEGLEDTGPLSVLGTLFQTLF